MLQGVTWSPTRNSIFFLATVNELLVFDLASLMEGPVVRHSFNPSNNTKRGSKPPSVAISDKLVVLLDGTTVQVHRVKDKYPLLSCLVWK